MTIRTLPPDEYHKLSKLEVPASEVIDWVPDPRLSTVVVAEEDEEIVAFWVLQIELHAEPCWIKPTHRSTTISGRLFKHILGMLPFEQRLFTTTSQPDVIDYLTRLGFRPAGAAFIRE